MTLVYLCHSMCTRQETPVRAFYSYFLPHTHSPCGAFLEKFSLQKRKQSRDIQGVEVKSGKSLSSKFGRNQCLY